MKKIKDSLCGCLALLSFSLFCCSLFGCTHQVFNNLFSVQPSDPKTDIIVIDPDAPAQPKLAFQDTPAKQEIPVLKVVEQQAPVSEVETVSLQIEQGVASNAALAQAEVNQVAEPTKSERSLDPTMVKPVEEEKDLQFAVVGQGPETYYIKADEINIRSEANRYSKIIGLLHGGDEVRVSMHGDWAKLSEGQWIRSRWLVKERPKKFQRPNRQKGRDGQTLSSVSTRP